MHIILVVFHRLIGLDRADWFSTVLCVRMAYLVQLNQAEQCIKYRCVKLPSVVHILHLARPVA